MKAFVLASIALSASIFVAHVAAHGQMLVPPYRPITAKYRQDCLWGLKGADDDELQWAPLENLSARGQAGQPAAVTFDIMNGCHGLVYEAESSVTELMVGAEFMIKYFIHALHPGTLDMYIVKPEADSAGKITYKQVTKLSHLDNFAIASGSFDITTETIPTSVTGCEKASDCVLQFYWYSKIANQTYPTCSDITIKGSVATAASTTTTKAPAAAPSAPASPSTTTTTMAPTSTSATDSKAGADRDDNCGKFEVANTLKTDFSKSPKASAILFHSVLFTGAL